VSAEEPTGREDTAGSKVATWGCTLGAATPPVVAETASGPAGAEPTCWRGKPDCGASEPTDGEGGACTEATGARDLALAAAGGPPRGRTADSADLWPGSTRTQGAAAPTDASRVMTTSAAGTACWTTDGAAAGTESNREFEGVVE